MYSSIQVNIIGSAFSISVLVSKILDSVLSSSIFLLKFFSFESSDSSNFNIMSREVGFFSLNSSFAHLQMFSTVSSIVASNSFFVI